MSRTQFLRDAKEGMTLVLKYSLLYTKDERPYAFVPRKIIKVQTNAVYLEYPNNKSLYTSEDDYNFYVKRWSGSYLEIPRASRVEYDGKTLKIYEAGERELTDKEKSIMNGWTEIKAKNPDASYSKMLMYFSNNKATHLIGNSTVKEMKYNRKTGKVWDARVKGKLELEYEVRK